MGGVEFSLLNSELALQFGDQDEVGFFGGLRKSSYKGNLVPLEGHSHLLSYGPTQITHHYHS